MDKKDYEIAGRKFYLRSMTFAQRDMINDIVSNGDFTGYLDLISVALVEDGQTQAEKSLAGIAESKKLRDWLKYNATTDEIDRLAADFFALNPSKKLEEMDARFLRYLGVQKESGLKTASSSSPTGISLSETGSTETSPQEKLNDTLPEMQNVA